MFLDIQMPGLTGFEVARRLIDAETPSHIIFVTAYDQHAIEAFEVNAVDYLLKPVDPARLEVAMQRGAPADRVRAAAGNAARRERRAAREDRPDRRGAAEPARAAGGEGRRAVPARAGRRSDLCVAGRRVITVVTGKHVGTSNCRTLDELQERLDPGIFWRVHRSHLVNINKIKEIVPWFSRNYILRMKDEKATEIPVSRIQTRRLREYLKL